MMASFVLVFLRGIIAVRDILRLRIWMIAYEFQCECIVTSASFSTTNADEPRTRGYSDSTEVSVGQPGSGTYAETTAGGAYSTTEASWNQTAASGGETTARETTGDVPRTTYANSSSPTTGSASESLTRSAASWSTTTESPADTQDPFSASFSSQDRAPTSSHSQSGNRTQTLQSNTGVTSQLSDTRTTRSGTATDSPPWSFPGISTSSPVESGTRPTGTLTGWNSSMTAPSGGISGTGPFVPIPTESALSSDFTSSGSSSSGSVAPSWNTTSASRGNGSAPTTDISGGSFVPFPTASASTITGASSSSTIWPSWNRTTSVSMGNGSVPTVSISRGTFVPFPTASVSASSGGSSSGSVGPSWNGTTSRGNGSVPTLSISSDTFVPFPTLSLSSQASSVVTSSGSNFGPSWNSTSLPSGGNTSATVTSGSSGSLVPFPTSSASVQTSSRGVTSGTSFSPSWNSTSLPSGANLSVPTVSTSGSFVPFPTVSLPASSSSVEATTGSSLSPSWNTTSLPPGGNSSVPTISTASESFIPFPTYNSGWDVTVSNTAVADVSLPTVSQATSGSGRSETLVTGWNTTTGQSEGSGSVSTAGSFESGSIVALSTESEILTSSQSGGVGWNITSSISGVISLPTISVPTSEIPTPPFPTGSSEVPSTTASESAVPSGDTTGSAPGSTGTVTSVSSPVAATSTSGASSGPASPGSNVTTTGVPEFPAANFTHVTRTAAISQETCYTLPNPDGDSTRRALLYNARLREDNVSIPIPYIESVEFEKDGVNPLYLTVRDEQGGIYYVDISHRGRLSVVDPNGYLVALDAKGIHFSGSNCTYDISISIDDMYEQIADLAGVQCAALKHERAEDLDFSQVLYLHDQCGTPVDRSVRQYPQLLVGDTVCADVAVDDDTGRWDFECTFPGSESGSLRCQLAIKNKVVDFISTDPFGGACPDLSTVVTTLEESGQDIVDPEQLRKDFANQGLSSDRAKQEADAAVVAYTQLWQALGAIFTKSTEASQGALEDYIDVYNTRRSFENDICQSLHEGEIPLNLTLIAGATRIPAITTLNWAPETTKPYNITVQDSSRIACCHNSAVAEGEGATCSYPRDAVIPGTGCVCGKSAAGVGIAFEWTECTNYKGSCEADGDCGDGYLCLTGSCCGGGVCVDAFACSQNGTDLVQQFDGGF
ncbi:hypothetical protein FOC4_g10004729 [Fusarium odoratissimum]|uniref:Uncharacterized protein n=1 Tax=Fusarium oxysporum f. sp. cubense (strain race 4) TaxID=2502994 RepID=N1SBE6_FUSC4|nr:hypothetical protein FOC4_g10004729 [Fusarium odoratissimum]